MILYDREMNEHYIREGKNKVYIKAEDFSLERDIKDDESAIKLEKDNLLTTKHILIHIFSKPTGLDINTKAEYVIWCGDIGTVPISIIGKKFWWEPGTITPIDSIGEEQTIDKSI